MKSPYKLLLLLLLTFSLLFVTQSFATTITVKSDATNLGAALAWNDPTINTRMNDGDTSGLTFSPVSLTDSGSFTTIPPGAPTGTVQVHVPPDCGWYCNYSGFVMTTFTLPGSYSNISLSGVGNVDDWGYVFLNGTQIGGQLGEFNNAAFSTSTQSLFQPGTNTLLFSDFNGNSGPDGPGAVAYYANITYTSSSTPEPGTLTLMGTALLGIAGAARRKFLR